MCDGSSTIRADSNEPQTRKDINIVSQTDGEIFFILDNATYELAALFRKILMIEIPIMAIYSVDVHKNTTMYETFNIIRKLRFIPLQIDPDRYKFSDECECTEMLRKDKEKIFGGCNECSCFFSLFVCGKNFTDSSLREITSKNIYSKDVDNVFENIPEIPIVRIKKGEELYLSCRAFKGRGKDNAMWSPVTVVTFSCLNEDLINDIPSYKEDKKFIFYFESVGQLSPLSILDKANDLYQRKKIKLSEKKHDIRHRYLPDEDF